MSTIRLVFIAVALLFLCDCAGKRPVTVHTDGILPVSCLQGNLQMVNCDFKRNPPKCKEISAKDVTYDPRCIKIVVKKP